MGYTHYWTIHPEKISPEQFFSFTEDVKAIIAASAVPVQYEYDDARPPEFGEGVVRFNGVDDDGHETFYFDVTPIVKPTAPKPASAHWSDLPTEEEKTLWWDWYEYERALRFGGRLTFCKTAQKPYDEIVTACLLSAEFHFGEGVEISSDGYWAEWQDGARLYTTATNREAECPFADEEVTS